MIQSRRDFISTVAIAGAAIPLTSNIESFLPGPSENKFTVKLFSKPLDSYDFGFMCECLNKSGIGGFDLTVRPGGKIEPAVVESELPKLIDEAKRHNLTLDMIVTGILSAKDPYTDRILKTASDCGVKNYRLGWYLYDNTIGVWESLLKHRDSL